MVELSFGEKNFIRGGIAQNLRCDGRKRLSYRPIFVDTGVIPQANDSARVRIGGTDVIASVKAELGRPNSSQPNKGKISIHIDCSATAAPIFQRCLLGGKSGAGAGIDLSSLSIVEGKVCWDLYIDGLVVSSDGNMLDTLGAAIKVGKHYIVDATEEEESQMSSAMSVSINRKGVICGLSKREGAGVDPSIVLDMISVAKHVSKNFINKLDSEIAAAEAREEES
uniref:Ribosomal RNA-processing protein 42 n=1 Tax=Chenopodium quinoa TaxID=63459 RepID=A0A803L3C9_CHEQI